MIIKQILLKIDKKGRNKVKIKLVIDLIQIIYALVVTISLRYCETFILFFTFLRNWYAWQNTVAK